MDFVNPYKPRKRLKEEDITIELLEECYQTAAKVVRLHGDYYLPIFERLHKELEIRRQKEELMKLAIRVSMVEENNNQVNKN